MRQGSLSLGGCNAARVELSPHPEPIKQNSSQSGNKIATEPRNRCSPERPSRIRYVRRSAAASVDDPAYTVGGSVDYNESLRINQWCACPVFSCLLRIDRSADSSAESG